MTNVRFTSDKHHVISVGGADNAVFQWKFVTAEEEDNESGLLGGDSDSEASDSDLSDVGSLDSDLEREQEKSYERLYNYTQGIYSHRVFTQGIHTGGST